MLKNDRFLVLENDRILVFENDRFLVLENDRHPLRNPVLGCATMATAAVPPAELAMVSTRSVREKVFLMMDLLRLFLWSVAVVMTKRPLEKLVLPSKSSMTCETSVFRSAATSLQCPIVQTESLVVGNASRCEAAKFL